VMEDVGQQAVLRCGSKWLEEPYQATCVVDPLIDAGHPSSLRSLEIVTAVAAGLYLVEDWRWGDSAAVLVVSLEEHWTDTKPHAMYESLGAEIPPLRIRVREIQNDVGDHLGLNAVGSKKIWRKSRVEAPLLKVFSVTRIVMGSCDERL